VKKQPRVLVLTGFGINCDYETRDAFELVGAKAERVHLNEIILRKKLLRKYQLLAFPGGFSFGDDIASGRVLANKFKFNLRDELREFIESGKLILGICNGFQVLVKLGVLPGFTPTKWKQVTTLTFNTSGRFEDRWVYLKVNSTSPCIFTQGLELIYLPVRHGEGRFITGSKSCLEHLFKQRQVVLQYARATGKLARGVYPFNPNGSEEDIAGICDKTGRIFGLMPHPEAYLHRVNHPRWTREALPEEGIGLKIFRNAVEYIKKNF
jgi:phosphoribosylformylglycinamidine synthase